jgi:hypothetical protein
MTALNQAPDAGIGRPGNREVAALYQNAYVSASRGWAARVIAT